MQNIDQDGVEKQGSDYKYNPENRPDILAIAITNTSADPTIAPGGHSGPEKYRHKKIHKCIVA